MDEEILKHLQEINGEDFPEEKHPRIKKLWLVLISVFLVMLMISFIFVTFPIGDILQGKLESNLLQGNVISLDDFKIIFEDGTEEVLKSYYFNEQEVEISLCLEGYQEGDYYITSLYEPKTYASAYNQVSFQPCSLKTMVILHTHPFKRCVASEADLEMLSSSKEVNSDVLMVVMCEAERFSVYGEI